MEMAKEPSRYHQNLCAAWRLVRKPRAVEKGLAHGTWAGFCFYKPTWRGLTIILFISIDLISDSIGLAVHYNTILSPTANWVHLRNVITGLNDFCSHSEPSIALEHS